MLIKSIKFIKVQFNVTQLSYFYLMMYRFLIIYRFRIKYLITQSSNSQTGLQSQDFLSNFSFNLNCGISEISCCCIIFAIHQNPRRWCNAIRYVVVLKCANSAIQCVIRIKYSAFAD